MAAFTVKLRKFFYLYHPGGEIGICLKEKYVNRSGAKFEIHNNGSISEVSINYQTSYSMPEMPLVSFINIGPRGGGVMVSVSAPEEIKISRKKLEGRVVQNEQK
jgi:hypothetical protein